MYGARLPDELVKRLDAWAKVRGLSRSEAIRQLVEAGLKKNRKAVVDEPDEVGHSEQAEIDHKKRQGKPYEPKPPMSDEDRQQRSLAMKAFNKRTGKATLTANAAMKRARNSKA